MEKVYVKITLTDFTPISEAKITTENKDVEERLSKNKEKFVKNCLDNIKKDNLIINYNRANANQPLNFYKSFNNDCYTDGYVGVMKSTFQAHENFDPIQNNTQGDAVQASYEVEAIIEIRSRFDNDPKKPYFLSTMLMESLGLKLDHSLVPTNDDDFFDFLLIFLFKQQLETAYEKGFYKTYVSFEENDDKPKDTIDIDRHIRLNMGQNNGKIAYSHRESTYNNPFNHLIICAYEYLKKKFPDQTEAMINDCTAYDAIRQIRTFISYNNYQNSIMIAKNLRPITHPFFLEYEALRQTCIMILRDEGVSIFSGNENETQSIVFYLPDLWELYMEKHLKKDKMDYKINSQCKLKVLSMQEIPNDKISQIEFKCDDNGDFRLKTYPDFVFFDGDTPFMILDAKFKLEKWVSNGNITNANLDDYTKCLRDMVDFNSHATGVIYPTKNKDEKASVHYISEHNRTDHFYLFPVIIPDVKEELSYFDWHEQLTKYMNSSAKSINDYAEKEKERIKSYRSKIT